MNDNHAADVITDEFRRKLWESRNHLANPTLEKCWVHVELDPDQRVPRSKQTRFDTFPKDVGDGDDTAQMMLRWNEALDYLLENREFIVSGYESGSNSYRMNIHNYSNDYVKNRPSVCLFYKDAKGKWVSSGLQ